MVSKLPDPNGAYNPACMYTDCNTHYVFQNGIWDSNRGVRNPSGPAGPTINHPAGGYNGKLPSPHSEYNQFHGSPRDDTLIGTGNRDSMVGYDGNDYFYGLGSADKFYGGNGIDTASYFHSKFGVRANLSGIGPHGEIFNSIENLTGSRFNDTLTGDGGANFLQGLDGNDRFNGGLGADSLLGGLGTDTALYGQSNASVIVDLAKGRGWGGFAEGDNLVGVENVNGTPYSDKLSGDNQANRLDGDNGHDFISGLGGHDLLIGGGGNDTLKGELGNDTLNGGGGSDTFVLNANKQGIDTIQDFQVGPGGDKLNLHDVLQGANYKGGSVEEYVRVFFKGGQDVVQVDPHGKGQDSGWQDVAILQGHAGLDIQTLVENQQVIT